MSLVDLTEILPRFISKKGRTRRLPEVFFQPPPTDQQEALDGINIFGVNVFELSQEASQNASQPASQQQSQLASQHASQQGADELGAPYAPEAAEDDADSLSEWDPSQAASQREDEFKQVDYDDDDDEQLLQRQPSHGSDEEAPTPRAHTPEWSTSAAPAPSPTATTHALIREAPPAAPATPPPPQPSPLPPRYESSSPAPMAIKPQTIRRRTVRRSYNAFVSQSPLPTIVWDEVEDAKDEEEDEEEGAEEDEDGLSDYAREQRRKKVNVKEPKAAVETEGATFTQKAEESLSQSQDSSQVKLGRYSTAHDMENEEEEEDEAAKDSLPTPPPSRGAASQTPEQSSASTSGRRVVLVPTTDESDPRGQATKVTQSSPVAPTSSAIALQPQQQKRSRPRTSTATNASADADDEAPVGKRRKDGRQPPKVLETPARPRPSQPTSPSVYVTPENKAPALPQPEPAGPSRTPGGVRANTGRTTFTVSAEVDSPIVLPLAPKLNGWMPDLSVDGLKATAVRRMGEDARRERRRLEELRSAKKKTM